MASSVDDQPPARQHLLLPIPALFPTLIPFLWGEELATAIEFHGFKLVSSQWRPNHDLVEQYCNSVTATYSGG